MKNKFQIGEVAKYLDVTTDTLRYYDREEIIKPSKIGENGYRYYTLEDVIKLTYVITFRYVGMSIKEIKDRINNCTLSELEVLLKEKEALIEDKINSLKKLKKKVSNFRGDIKRTMNILNTIEITKCPYMVYEEFQGFMDAAMFKRIKNLESNDSIHSVIFSVVINEECFNAEVTLEEHSLCAISGVIEGNTFNNDEEQYILYKYDKCIHSIFKIDFDIRDEDLRYLCKYISSNNLEVIGKSIARFITFENDNGKPYDYIEVWIPIK